MTTRAPKFTQHDFPLGVPRNNDETPITPRNVPRITPRNVARLMRRRAEFYCTATGIQSFRETRRGGNMYHVYFCGERSWRPMYSWDAGTGQWYGLDPEEYPDPLAHPPHQYRDLIAYGERKNDRRKYFAACNLARPTEHRGVLADVELVASNEMNLLRRYGGYTNYVAERMKGEVKDDYDWVDVST